MDCDTTLDPSQGKDLARWQHDVVTKAGSLFGHSCHPTKVSQGGVFPWHGLQPPRTLKFQCWLTVWLEEYSPYVKKWFHHSLLILLWQSPLKHFWIQKRACWAFSSEKPKNKKALLKMTSTQYNNTNPPVQSSCRPAASHFPSSLPHPGALFKRLDSNFPWSAVKWQDSWFV